MDPYLSSASYYDCPQGSGACGLCVGNPYDECAYPNVTGHPPDYATNCGGISEKDCGSFIVVTNICNPYWYYTTGVKVVDHGPNPRLVCAIDRPRCNSLPCNRYVDLARSTYIRLNGNLAEGLMLCLVYT